MNTKPLKIDINDGEIKQFQTGDRLSIEAQLERTQLLIRKLIFILISNGIQVSDKDLLEELSKL